MRLLSEEKLNILSLQTLQRYKMLCLMMLGVQTSLRGSQGIFSQFKVLVFAWFALYFLCLQSLLCGVCTVCRVCTVHVCDVCSVLHCVECGAPRPFGDTLRHATRPIRFSLDKYCGTVATLCEAREGQWRATVRVQHRVPGERRLTLKHAWYWFVLLPI